MSSSSDEEILLNNPFLKLKRTKTGIYPINQNRTQFGEYHKLFKELKDYPDRFYRYMRMNLDTFNYLLEKIGHRLMKTWCNWHKQSILPEERLVITIRYLATGCSFKSISFLFRVGASTVGDIIRETVENIWQELQPEYMPQPTKNQFNFPNVIGTIDGKHVRILCSKKSGSMFFNYKKYFLVVLQGVVDANYQFIAIDVGGYGKQSDGGTFQASDFYKRLIRKKIHVPEPAFLPGTNVKAPYVFLADEAYPLLNFLLKPYRGQNIPIDQETFNNRLSRARKSVECAFGILCAKWRLLYKAIETDVHTADNIIRCVCILHNLILKREGLERHLTDVEIIRNNHQGLVGRPSTSAVAVRHLFKTFIIDNPLVYT